MQRQTDFVVSFLMFPLVLCAYFLHTHFAHQPANKVTNTGGPVCRGQAEKRGFDAKLK